MFKEVYVPVYTWYIATTAQERCPHWHKALNFLQYTLDMLPLTEEGMHWGNSQCQTPRQYLFCVFTVCSRRDRNIHRIQVDRKRHQSCIAVNSSACMGVPTVYVGIIVFNSVWYAFFSRPVALYPLQGATHTRRVLLLLLHSLSDCGQCASMCNVRHV